MKICLLQRDIVWNNPLQNRKRIDEAIDGLAEDTDVVVLPEMFSTGFAPQPAGLAESNNGDTLRWMKARATEHHCAFAGSLAVESEGKFFNRFYFVKPDGSANFYDKHHLFTYGGEDKTYTPGTEQVIVEFRGWRIALFVCYDLRFPAWSRNKKAYDLALYVASWPTSRVDVWNTLLKARAIENQCFVAGVNRVGEDPSCKYCGCSTIVNPYGQVMVSCGRDVEQTAEAELDLEKLRAFRKKFPVLDDADAFCFTEGQAIEMKSS